MFYGLVGDDEDVAQYTRGGGSPSVGLYCSYHHSHHHFSSCYRHSVEGTVMKALYSTVESGSVLTFLLKFSCLTQFLTQNIKKQKFLLFLKVKPFKMFKVYWDFIRIKRDFFYGNVYQSMHKAA